MAKLMLGTGFYLTYHSTWAGRGMREGMGSELPFWMPSGPFPRPHIPSPWITGHGYQWLVFYRALLPPDLVACRRGVGGAPCKTFLGKRARVREQTRNTIASGGWSRSLITRFLFYYVK